ncbi:MAG: L-histidine N(alpha)-methyltransferase [Thermoanaerobaculia bacterium]
MRTATRTVTLIDLHPHVESMRHEVLSGLRRPQKSLPPKFFYDEEGSRLFEEITRLPEYYPTRTEIAILEGHAGEMVELMGERPTIVELGSGNSTKVRILLDRIDGGAKYVPVDISKDLLAESAGEIKAAYPSIEVVAVCADYTRPFDIPAATGAKRIVFFPGSTVGNLEPKEVQIFFATLIDELEPGDGMLIGVDLKKDRAILHDAYNDSRGVTAAFNLNVLRHINRKLHGSFDLERFTHRAFYDERAGRIEMHLVSTTDQIVSVGGERIGFTAGETIHTESSYKYSVDEFRELATETGFTPRSVWTDPDSLFSVHYLEVE